MEKRPRAKRPPEGPDVLADAGAAAAGLLNELGPAPPERERLSDDDALRLAACSVRALFEAIVSNRAFAEQYLDALRHGDRGRLEELVGQFMIFGCRTQPILCDPNGRNCLGSVTCCIIFGFRFCIVIIRPTAAVVATESPAPGKPEPVAALRIAACHFGLVFEKIALDKAFAKRFLQALRRGNARDLRALLSVITFGPCRIIAERDRVTICCTFRGTEYCLIIFRGQEEARVPRPRARRHAARKQ